MACRSLEGFQSLSSWIKRDAPMTARYSSSVIRRIPTSHQRIQLTVQAGPTTFAREEKHDCERC